MFKTGTQLTEGDLTNPRELWQMRANLSRELLEEICHHGHEILYHLPEGDALNKEQVDQLRLIYQNIDEAPDYLQRIHLNLRNPDQTDAAD